MKESGLRIRVENELRKAFIRACKQDDLTASQVLRAFMRSYLEQKSKNNQPDLFRDAHQITIEEHGNGNE